MKYLLPSVDSEPVVFFAVVPARPPVEDDAPLHGEERGQRLLLVEGGTKGASFQPHSIKVFKPLLTVRARNRVVSVVVFLHRGDTVQMQMALS